MKITIQVSDEQGTVAQKEITIRPEEAGLLQRGLEEAFAFLRREALLMVRRRDIVPAAPGEALYPEPASRPSHLTLMETLQGLLETDFPQVWFTSQEVQRSFREAHGAINLSTISTYLARLHRVGVLERSGNRRRWVYRLVAGRAPGGAREITLP